MTVFRSATTSAPACAALIVAMAASVLTVTPLTGVLEIRHALASATGAESATHSESDLCVWMTIHVAGMLTVCPPALAHGWLPFLHNAAPASRTLAHSRPLSSAPSRAPPASVASRST